jgi:hypothetical protein
VNSRRRSAFLAVILLPTLVLAWSCGNRLFTGPVLSKPGTTTTIILVRHTEREPGFDPPINAEGVVRAQRLADVLAENGVTAIYVADFIRNHQSAQPTADRLGLPITAISQLQLADTKALANTLVAEWLNLHAGGVVVWIGNTGPIVENQSGNLQELYFRLGGTGDPPIRYEDFTVIVVPDEGDTHLIRASYGGPSSLD